MPAYKSTSRATHECSWNNYQCCPAPPPPSCNLNREYNECNSNCNGTNYPDDHLVHVTEYTNPSGGVCRYECSDLGRVPGQCGVPGTTPQLYGCNGTRCEANPNGFSSDPNCGGQCAVSPTPPPPPLPPGCTPINLSVNPSSVGPGGNLEFRASSSYAYQNVSINMGGGASETGFGCCDPSYTWRWYGRASSPGSYTARFSGN
ncbi:hypothetical protein HYU96_00215, partial [Candidatus Daviesbacteria bacterium]|nr:hypothetical protein [Candidatus Daviesbacteria bacterium]